MGLGGLAGPRGAKALEEHAPVRGNTHLAERRRTLIKWDVDARDPVPVTDVSLGLDGCVPSRARTLVVRSAAARVADGPNRVHRDLEKR